jgi:hypothetical protein
VVEFKGMMTLVTKLPPLSTATVEPKLIFVVGTRLLPMVMLETVEPPPVVKPLPVTVIAWLGRAVAGDRVIDGLDDCSPGSAKATDSPVIKIPTAMSTVAANARER